MRYSLAPALRMGAIGPLGEWLGPNGVALAKQAASSNNWLAIAVKNAALGAVIGHSPLFGQCCSTTACPHLEWVYGAHSQSRG